ncbi:MAG: nucleotide exchange factor GrpE [Cytophagales bacterium]|nr:nucleotide exchange factor GrpE [Cytophagales bacterium]
MEEQTAQTSNADDSSSDNVETLENPDIQADNSADIEPLKNEISELKDKLLRLTAEFDNYRKRTAKERIELIGAANEQLILAILPAKDDFDRAIATFDHAEDINTLKEGILLIYNKLNKTLEAKGLKPLDAKGADFNADIHEAITQIPAPEPSLKGKVVDEIEKGYYLHEKLIRVAKVVIGN